MPIISEKTRKFIKGRRGLQARIKAACEGVSDIVWVHSPSYGEFEEARPVLSEMRRLHPEYKFLVTFFSPSGYEHLKDDPACDFVFYLPLDGPVAAKRFLSAVNPVKAVFCIADFWLFYLRELKRRGVETYLVSARFNSGMSYFKPFGRPFLNAFKTCFTKIFVTNQESLDVLGANGITNCLLLGDPRMDRVLELSSQEWSEPMVSSWAGGRKVFVAGSVLPDMDSVIVSELANARPDGKFLVVPHEIASNEISRLSALFKGKVALYSSGMTPDLSSAQVLIVDAVGLLSRLYRYGFIAYVGAGFDGAPHSIIEPAAYGIPVCFGPQFGPVWHCQKMIDAGAGFCIRNVNDMISLYDGFSASEEKCREAGIAARSYCVDGGGVARKIAELID